MLFSITAAKWVYVFNTHINIPSNNMFLLTSQGLPDYTKWLTHYSTKQQDNTAKPITCRSYARWDGTNYFRYTWFKKNLFLCKCKYDPPSNPKTGAI